MNYRIFFLIIFLSCNFNLKAQEVVLSDADRTIYTNMLDSLMKLKEYEEAESIVNVLKGEDSLTPHDLINCIDCLIYLNKFNECIEFCDFRYNKFPEDRFLLFLSAKGEAYYRLEEYDKALEYMSDYFYEAEENELDPGGYYMGMYADILYATLHFKDAEKYYKLFFEDAIKLENLTWETLKNSVLSGAYGYKLYNLAYSCFFQGKELDGLNYLLLSQKCGNEYATDDCKILAKSSTFARNVEYKSGTIKDFKEYIEALNIIPDKNDFSANQFWINILEKNSQYQEFYITSHKDKMPGTLKKALTEVSEGKSSMEKSLYECHPYVVGKLEKFLDNYLCGDRTLINELRFYPAEYPNAFATPFGEIYITEGLARLYHFNKAMLIGICAHELTHFLCQHTAVALWKQAKKEKKNNIWSGIAVGLNTLAHGAAAMYDASNGLSNDDRYWNSVTQINNSFMQSFKADSYYFQFKYGREQELESDIMAYRFCEYMGIGGYAYIMALQLLGDGNGYLNDKDSDHPTTAFRVGLLKYLYALEHPTE